MSASMTAAATWQLAKLRYVHSLADNDLIDAFEKSSVNVQDFWDDPENSPNDDRMHRRLRDEIVRRMMRK
jgi:hypothetical protein